jgi:integrase
MSALTYMQRRSSGTYEFRKRLPEALAGKPVPPHMRDAFSELVNPATGCFKRELVRSLDTKDEKQAKRSNHREALRVAQLFDAACNAIAGGPPPRLALLDLRQLEADVLSELLRADEDERAEGDDRRRLQTSADRARWPDLEPALPSPTLQPHALDAPLAPAAKGMAVDHFEAYGELLDDLEDDYREAWARSDPSIVRAETRIAFKRRGIPINETSPEFREAGLAVLKAHVRAYELMRQRQGGSIIETPPVAKPKDRGPKLSEALASWKTGGTSRRGKTPAAKSIVEAEQAVRAFSGLHGDLHLGDITREHARAVRDALAQTPKALPKALRNLPLPVLMQRDLSQYQLRSPTTVNKLIGLLGGIISQSERDGALDKLVPAFVNPFANSMMLRTEEGEDSREPFDRTDLKAIFTSPIYSTIGERPDAGGGEAAFWFPLIALFSGMRLDEIAQLRLCDLREDDETRAWYFDVSRAGGRRTKNIGSMRSVPVHQELARIGLLRYRQSLLDARVADDASLWPDLQNAAQWSKWFGRHRRSLGITDRKKVFHSFRHTFKRMCRDAGVSEELHDALTGHTGGGKVGRTYGRGFSLAPLVAATNRMVPPVDLSTLDWSPPQ